MTTAMRFDSIRDYKGLYRVQDNPVVNIHGMKNFPSWMEIVPANATQYPYITSQFLADTLSIRAASPNSEPIQNMLHQ